MAIWKQFEACQAEISPHSLDARYYGVSFAAAPDGSFDYLVGMIVGKESTPPEGVQVREVPAATYAVFACEVHAIGPTYGHIFGEWRAASGYEVDPTKCVFEQYPPATETNAPVLIHVPLRE
ncbi:MAG: GyrI-like domain-containing protein [Opitutaceae bacterium]|nr:GyrI-like domain-containing protein [Opitutaceae bacterium]